LPSTNVPRDGKAKTIACLPVSALDDVRSDITVR
jgi:hypothetical protein